MPLDPYANFIRGELAAAVDSTQTALPVVDASIFPDPSSGAYNLVLWDAPAHPAPYQDPDVEIVRVTARDTGTDELTVTRGQEDTTGASHPAESALQLALTEKFVSDVQETFLSDPTEVVRPGPYVFGYANPLSDVRDAHAATTLNGAAYVFGGRDAAGDPQDTVYKYDDVSDSWTTVAPLPDARDLHAAATLNGSAYVFGGRDGGGATQDTAFRYFRAAIAQ